MVGYLKAIVPAPQKYKETYLKAFTEALNEAKRSMLKDYRDTTSTWKHKVKFTASLPRMVKGEYMIAVGTDDKIYGYVDKGTRRHIIRPKRRSCCAFEAAIPLRPSP